MASKKGGLGKGLDALFEDNAVEEENASIQLKLSEIEPNRDQPRKDIDETALAELADSIAQHGILQPLLVRPLIGGGYQLVAGERRWRAARIAGLNEVPVVIRNLTDCEMAELALIENLQREDLNPLEEAEGYRQLMSGYGMTQEEVAKVVGKSRPAVANAVRLLALPEKVRSMVEKGEISAGHARCLLNFSEEEALALAQEIFEKGLSVREIEQYAQKKSKKAPTKTGKNFTKRDTFYDEVELALASELARKVKINAGRKKNSLEIEFYNREELMDIVNRLAGKMWES